MVNLLQLPLWWAFNRRQASASIVYSFYFSLVCTTNPDLLRIGGRERGGEGGGGVGHVCNPRLPDSSWSSRKEIWVAKRVRERGGDEGGCRLCNFDSVDAFFSPLR
jgi:hypothetical protein